MVAIPTQLVAVTPLESQGKMLAANDLRHFINPLFGFHGTKLIYESLVVYR